MFKKMWKIVCHLATPLNYPEHLKGIINPKIESSSKNVQVHVVPNLNDLLSSAKHRRYFWRLLVSKEFPFTSIEFLVRLDGILYLKQIEMRLWGIHLQCLQWLANGPRSNSFRNCFALFSFLSKIKYLPWIMSIEVNGNQNGLVINMFKISSFVSHRRNKVIQVWNEMQVSKWWLNFNFWLNYPFNNCIAATN